MHSHHNKREAKKPRQTSGDAPSRAIQYVQDNRGRALTLEERLVILSLHANFHKDESAVPRKQSVTNKISRLLLQPNKTVGKVWSDFIEHDAVFIPDVPTNRNERPTRILKSVSMLTAVWSFVRTRCETRIRTTAKDVMHFLVEEPFLCVDMIDQVQVKTALRQVQRFLKGAEYSRGEHKAVVLKLSPQNDLRRAEYVLRMTYGDDKRRVVCMDESYTHQRYARHNDSLFDPSDKSSVKSKHMGRRLCFIAAIIARDQSVRDEDRVPHQRADLLGETVDIFEGVDGEITSVPEEQMPLQLLDHDGQRQVPQVSPHISTKERQQEGGSDQRMLAIWNRCAAKRIQADPVGTSLQSHRKERRFGGGGDGAATRARSGPIEITSAIVKGEVGRQHTTGTTFDDIRTRPNAAFRNMQSSTVQGCINAANQQLFEQKKHLDTMGGQNESSSDAEELEPDSDLD